jgi:glycosyltransferase involved in cell wall biosynthesis
MKIAILGTRGVPARYGGFETFAEQLATRLARDGHEVAVYCLSAFTRPDDVLPPGVRRVVVPSLSSKYLDTLWHGCLSALHAAFSNADVVLMCNVANSLWVWLPRLAGKPTVLNVDGLDRKRKKWNVLGQAFLFLCEVLSSLTPSHVVTDSYSIQQYYRQRYRCSSRMIAYGAEALGNVAGPEKFGLEPGRYLLYVSRLEPENNPELVIRAYGRVSTDWPLVIVGGNPYNPEYVRHLESISDPRVRFTGAVYGEGYWTLQQGAGVFVSAFEIGGTHPALVEAMAARNAVLYLNTVEGRETVADAGLPFEHEVEDLAEKLRLVIADEKLRSELQGRGLARVAQHYTWDAITAQYEALFSELIGRPKANAARQTS